MVLPRHACDKPYPLVLLTCFWEPVDVNDFLSFMFNIFILSFLYIVQFVLMVFKISEQYASFYYVASLLSL